MSDPAGRSEVEVWQRELDEFVRRERPACLSTVKVLDQALSTQDVAKAQCRGQGGMLVTAMRQTAGRGRLGRPWTHVDGKGLAFTLSVEAAGARRELLPIAVGVAVAEALETVVSGLNGLPRIGIRWPNDVVECAHGRKLAGVLIESSAPGPFLVGVGINVEQEAPDWPTDLRDRACSLAQLGASCDRLGVLVEVLRALDRALSRRSVEKTLAQWRARDVLIGRVLTVTTGARRVTGLAESIEPTAHLVLRTESGVEHLPAATTSLVGIAGSAW